MQRSAKNALLAMQGKPFDWVSTPTAKVLVRDGYCAPATVETRFPPRGKVALSLTARGRGWLASQHPA